MPRSGPRSPRSRRSSASPLRRCASHMRRAETDDGLRGGLTSTERQRMKELEGEVRELRRANEILKTTACCRCATHGRLWWRSVARPAASSSACATRSVPARPRTPR